MRIAPSHILLFALLLVSNPSGVEGQEIPIDWEPERLHVGRAELEDLMERWEAVASSEGYSSGAREDARRAAVRIRERLAQGDFRVGDRVALRVEGETTIPDTLIVEPGPSIVIEHMGTLSLAGVLRSELRDHLTKELSVYIREPIVYASATVRIQMEGAVGQPGFYTFPSDMLLSQTIMSAGGPGGDANLEEIEIRRSQELLLEDDDVSSALQDGRSLDQLNLRGGDRIVIPAEGTSIWPSVIRWGAVIASTMLLGVRIFY